MKRKHTVQIALIGIFVFVFCFSAYQIGLTYCTGQQEQQKFDELKELVEAANTAAPVHMKTEITQDHEEQSILPEYMELIKMNEDFFGWLRIEDTPINYPVMHTPADSQFYLHRAFDKSDAQSGTPFLDGACYEGCGMYLIYGHHMKNDTMFGTLPKYGSKDYWEDHKTIHFDTRFERGEYEVIAAFYSEIYDEREPGFRYYQYTDLTNPAVFDEYMEQVEFNAIYETGVSAEYGDQLLVLSTCNYHTNDGRFVVVARKTEY